MSVKHPRIVCFGNLTIDDTVLPDGTERPGCVGGDALYAALGARLWEPATEIVAPRGHDFPADVTARLEALGFSLEGFPERAVRTIHNRVRYDSQGGRHWTLYSPEQDFHLLSPLPDDIPTNYRQADAFLIAAMSLEAQEELAAWLKAQTAGAIALDLQEDYISGNEERLRALIGRADLFLPSEEEVRRLLGHEEWLRAAQEFARMGPGIVVIKRGSAGSLAYDARTGQSFEVPAYPVAVVDMTGAGDAFCGGFVAGFVRDPQRLEHAARGGAVSASFAIAGFSIETLSLARPADAVARLSDWLGRMVPSG